MFCDVGLLLQESRMTGVMISICLFLIVLERANFAKASKGGLCEKC
jgi:hypothetical protein